MKRIIFFGAAFLAVSTTFAQNSAVINQQGNSHNVSVGQHGNGNTSVITQNNSKPGNSATISQSGAGNVATINQGSDSSSVGGQSVNVTQSGNAETHIDQTDSSNNHIIINQTGDFKAVPAMDNQKKQPKAGKKSKPKK